MLTCVRTILIFLAIGSSLSFAQTQTVEVARLRTAVRLVGTVVDPTGAPIATATVTEMSNWKHALRSVATDSHGALISAARQEFTSSKFARTDSIPYGYASKCNPELRASWS